MAARTESPFGVGLLYRMFCSQSYHLGSVSVIDHRPLPGGWLLVPFFAGKEIVPFEQVMDQARIINTQSRFTLISGVLENQQSECRFETGSDCGLSTTVPIFGHR